MLTDVTVRLYIPRMLSCITPNMVRTTFERLNIGKVSYIDMHRKINENKRVYYIAFIEVNLYDTPAAEYIQNMLRENSPVKLVYDEEAAQYWELKKYIPKNERLYNVCKQAKIVPVLYETFMKYIPQDVNNENEEEDNFNYYADVYYPVYNTTYNMWENKFNLL